MKRVLVGLSVLVAAGLCVPQPAAGQGFLKKLFRDELAPAPSASELSGQEADAAAMMRTAQELDQKGSTGRAISAYEKIVKKYPLTDAAGTAQFRKAELLESEGKLSKAFDAYQEFIDSYRRSARFSDAVQRQFEIAVSSKNGEKSARFLFIPRRLDPSRVEEMFDMVIANAPRSELAPKAQFAIGEVWESDGDATRAVLAYQKVVDNYPETAIAADAQLAIGKMSFDQVEGGSNDAGSLMAAQEALEDVLLLESDAEDRAEAEALRSQLDETSAAQSFKVAEWYEKTGNLKAAVIYYNDVLQVPSSVHFADARERLAEIAAADPAALEQAPEIELAQNDFVVPAAEDVKSRADYLGPPAPPSRTLRKPRMRATPTEPIIPIEEPALPGNEGMDLTRPIDGQDLLLPPPPPLPGGATTPEETDSTPGLPPLPEMTDAPAEVEEIPVEPDAEGGETETEAPAPPPPPTPDTGTDDAAGADEGGGETEVDAGEPEAGSE